MSKKIFDLVFSKVNGIKVIKTYPDSGQKQVFLIETKEYNTVMLKIIKKMDERVKREIDIVNSNNICGVPKILSFDSVNYNDIDYYYVLEEYISGETLISVLEQRNLTIYETLNLIEDLLKTITILENINIVHRDIKPANIIYGEDKKFHLIDFGIARNLNLKSLTYTMANVGPHTPGYGAPELFQYDKSNINSKADLFSVGVVAYEAIFGEHPFVTGNEIDYNQIWYQTKTVNPKTYIIDGDTDGFLVAFIKTLMQKQPTKRPPSAAKALEWFYTTKRSLNI